MGLSDIETIPETGAVFTIGRSRFADNVASHFFIRKDPVISVTCGDEHSAVICQSGRLFVFGSNDWGQLGLGHKNHVSKPSCVKSMKPDKVTHVACGRAHTLICTDAQKIFACGSDQEAQLGRGSSAIGDSSSTPILVYDCGLTGPKVVQIAAGSHHSLALTSDGGVVAWGSNLEGQLGLPGISGLVNKPTKVQIPEPVKEISTGYYHSAFLTESGLIYVCGESESGKLGIDVNFSTQVAPKQMQLPSPAVRVVCGGHHTLILAENGNLYCAGSNVTGQLGLGGSVTEVQTPKLLPRGALQNEIISQIACGESHSAVLTESGKVFTCGDGRHGKLGLEENENNVHELTFALRYQELYVTNVACGGCHTILVGRRRESNNQTQRDMETTQTEHIQKKNPLPPLKLPVNRLQNGSPEKKAEEKGKTEIEQEKSNSETTTNVTDNGQENLENNQANVKDITADSMNNIEPKSPMKISEEATNKISASTTETNVEQTSENTETGAKVDSENNVLEEAKKEDGKTAAVEKEENEVSAIALDNKEDNKEDSKEDVKQDNKQDDKENNIEDNKEESNKESTHENPEESTEGKKTDVTSQKIESKENGGKMSPETEVSSPGPTPPPKPPRLKPGSGGSTSSDRKSLVEQEEENSIINQNNNAAIKEENETKVSEVTEHTNGSSVKQESSSIKSSSSTKKTSSAKSRVDTQETIETDKQNNDVVDGKDKMVAQENANHEAAQDDADVVQSPVRRTSKVSKLFKPKKQQEIENGTKAGGATSHKPKSKTCTVL